MKLYAPRYYSDFVCIADKCTHSCCIGWEVDVDQSALERYENLVNPYRDEIMKSISFEGEPHFTLCDDERCPHLNDAGLCKIILSAGEDYLCDICREHPRFYNNSPSRSEVGLGMACEEASRIILSRDDYDCYVTVGETDCEEQPDSFDPLPLREEIWSRLKADSTYEEKLNGIYGHFGVSPAMFTDEYWRGVLDEAEYLYSEHKEMFAAYTSSTATPKKYAKQLERALAYYVARHCTEAQSHEDFLSRLGFALFCERLLASLITRLPKVNIITLAVAVSEELEYCEENTEKILICFDSAL